MAVDLAELRTTVAEEPAFQPNEYEQRVQRARRAMEEGGLDALILFDPASTCYFTGFHTVNLWDVSAVVIPLDGPVRILLWEFEIARYEVSAAYGEPLAYSVGSDPVAAIGDALRPARIRSYGTDDWTPWGRPSVVARLREALEPALPANPRPVLWATRLRKSPAELELLREAARATDAGFAAALAAAAPAAIDHELAAAAAAAMLQAGSGHFAIQPIVCVGPRAGVMHSEASGRAIEPGDGIFVEIGASIGRYTAPVMRTLVVGSPHDELVKLATLASSTVHAAVEAMRPGISCEEVARAAKAVISEAAPEMPFHGYVGYPIGVSFPPSWIENLDFYINLQNPALLEEGMVFHLPLSLRQKGERGVGLSYTVCIGPDGAEVLTGTRAELVIR